MYETLNHKKAFEGKILDVYHDEIVLEDGRTALREVVSRVNASTVLPIDKDGNIIFVRQYRHPAKKRILELPAGTFEKHEEPLVCAERELEEETGFKGRKFTFLTKFYSAVGYSTEILFAYLAEDLVQTEQNLDHDEFVILERYNLNEALKLIESGEIIDSKTITALLYYNTFKTKQ